jgi:acetyl esterase/lipase
MPHEYHPDFAAAVAPLAAAMAEMPKMPPGDVKAGREVFKVTLEPLLSSVPFNSDVVQTTHKIQHPLNAGHTLDILHYALRASDGVNKNTKSPAVVQIHGGGMFLGQASAFAGTVSTLVAATGFPFFSVEYTLAPEATGSAQPEECLAAIKWVQENAEKFGVDPARVAVYGDSAGGGIAASTALLARARTLNPPLAKQILIYPMLDDRTLVPDEAIAELALWKYEENKTGWGARRGQDLGKDDHDGFSVPARAKDLSGLPRTYIDVGTLDIFRDEDLLYVERLVKSGVEVELHLYPGVPHAFELIDVSAGFAKSAFDNRVRALKDI